MIAIPSVGSVRGTDFFGALIVRGDEMPDRNCRPNEFNGGLENLALHPSIANPLAICIGGLQDGWVT